MTNGIQLKICGLRSLGDAEFAAKSGADYLGFILHPKSPRYLPLKAYREMASTLPKRPKVAVSVEPTLEEVAGQLAAGFDYFQIHFRHDLSLNQIEEWSAAVGSKRLWLAPKLPPAVDVASGWLPLAQTLMLDTFKADVFGGSGQTGDWAKFSRHRRQHPEQTWILAGGLNPNNVREAMRQSGAKFIDVNSGVEASPGVKDHAKVSALMTALRKP